MKTKKLKFKDLKKGMKVKDVYYSDTPVKSRNWGTGTVLKVLKTRVHINFSQEGLVIFDIAHANNFLEKVSRK